MRSVERTYEYLDGLALVALLRADNLDAQLFDENFVRQNWFHILAYGGFRVMVPSTELDHALQLCDSYHRGEFSLISEECEEPTCPACHRYSGKTDLTPRRRVFATLFLAYFFVGIPFNFATWDAGLLIMSTLGVSLPLLMPNLLRHFVSGRYRCSNCDHVWKSHPDRPFSEQQLQA